MAAMVKATYRRTFQCRSFESQTIELSVECDAVPGKVPLATQAGALYMQLERVGDGLMGEALGHPDPAGRK